MTAFRPDRQRDFPGGTVLVYSRPDAERVAADRIATTIREGVAARGRAVLGLATGSTPIAVYQHLIAQQVSGSLRFDSVTTYNLDEYYPISPADPYSYRAFMDRHLFHPGGFKPNQTHLLDGTIAEEYTEKYSLDFDRWIREDGGLDLQLLGLGRNGHIGFNEPSPLRVEQALTLPTRLVDLHPVTRLDAIKDFGAADLVPHRALTVGFATILAARSILVLAFGAAKADAVGRSVLGPVTAEVPGSLLQSVAAKVTWLVDLEAASCLF